MSIKKFWHKNHRINNTYDEMKVKDINNKNKIENEYFKINKDKAIFPE